MHDNFRDPMLQLAKVQHPKFAGHKLIWNNLTVMLLVTKSADTK